MSTLSILFIIFIVLLSPVFTIMAVNTLFTLSIPLTIWTYLSALWLTAFAVRK